MDWNGNLRVPFVSRPADNSFSFLYNYNYDHFPGKSSQINQLGFLFFFSLP